MLAGTERWVLEKTAADGFMELQNTAEAISLRSEKKEEIKKKIGMKRMEALGFLSLWGNITTVSLRI